MRQIQFRGLRTDGKGWACGDLIQPHQGNPDTFIAVENGHIQPVNPSTVGQFTGLYDRNGVKIWEGDTVIWGDLEGYSSESFIRHSVVQIDPDLQLRIIGYTDRDTGERKPSDDYVFRFGRFAYRETHKYLLVTGNIHEPATGRK